MSLRGIRGAITVNENSQKEISQASKLLISEILSRNELRIESIGAIIFSSTEDLTASFPSSAVRKLKEFTFVPFFDTREPAVENSLSFCIRVLILADLDQTQKEIRHVYLGDAKILRPDL